MRLYQGIRESLTMESDTSLQIMDYCLASSHTEQRNTQKVDLLFWMCVLQCSPGSQWTCPFRHICSSFSSRHGCHGGLTGSCQCCVQMFNKWPPEKRSLIYISGRFLRCKISLCSHFQLLWEYPQSQAEVAQSGLVNWHALIWAGISWCERLSADCGTESSHVGWKYSTFSGLACLVAPSLCTGARTGTFHTGH